MDIEERMMVQVVAKGIYQNKIGCICGIPTMKSAEDAQTYLVHFGSMYGESLGKAPNPNYFYEDEFVVVPGTGL